MLLPWCHYGVEEDVGANGALKIFSAWAARAAQPLAQTRFGAHFFALHVASAVLIFARESNGWGPNGLIHFLHAGVCAPLSRSEAFAIYTKHC
jgi:hypothetical protein